MNICSLATLTRARIVLLTSSIVSHSECDRTEA